MIAILGDFNPFLPAVNLPKYVYIGSLAFIMNILI